MARKPKRSQNYAKRPQEIRLVDFCYWPSDCLSRIQMQGINSLSTLQSHFCRTIKLTYLVCMKMVSFCYTTDKVLSEFYYNLLQEIIISCFYLGLKLFELQSYSTSLTTNRDSSDTPSPSIQCCADAGVCAVLKIEKST